MLSECWYAIEARNLLKVTRLRGLVGNGPTYNYYDGGKQKKKAKLHLAPLMFDLITLSLL